MRSGPASDVDLLVEMEPGRSLLDFVGLWQELEDLLDLKVDLVSEGGLSPYLREHHSSEGPGNPPAHQLGQEEVYIALRGSADVDVDGHRYPLDAGHIIRVGPTARRKILPGPDGVRLLAIGGIPGRAYDPASTV
jgi:mannose-6-phosphate isomerase-like protein (cupin superfamily)